MLRFTAILFFFLLSLLSVFKAPTNLLWYVEILVTEFPWVFLLIEIVLLIWGFKTQRFQTAGSLIALISILLYLSPVIKAYRIAGNLKSELVKSFPVNAPQNDKKPFQFFKMMGGIGAKSIPFKKLIYTLEGQQPLSLDFYPSQKKGVKPCVIVVHGGSWAGGDSRQLPELNSYLSKKGYHVASINYRLAPRHVSPAQVTDIRTAIEFLRLKAAELNIDSNNFVLLGRSAGGQLVLATAYTEYDPSIKGVISFYGPADLVWGAQNPASLWVFDSNKILEDFLGGTYTKSPQIYAAGSPINFVTAQAPPTLLLHGQNDVLVAYEHSIRLQEKLAQKGVPHFLLTLPWATHGFDYTLNGPGGQLSTYCVEQFLKNVTSQ